MNMNPLEVYAEAGRKAAEALNQHDWPRSRFHSDWMRKALHIETPEYAKQAREAFDNAYKSARTV